MNKSEIISKIIEIVGEGKNLNEFWVNELSFVTDGRNVLMVYDEVVDMRNITKSRLMVCLDYLKRYTNGEKVDDATIINAMLAA